MGTHNDPKYNRLCHIFIFITGIAYFFLIRQYVDAVDDIMYSFVREGAHIQWDHPVKNLTDVITSQSNDYFLRNGRVVAHSIVQTFLISPVWTMSFFIISSVIFILLQFGIMKLCQTINNRRYNPIIGLLFLLVLIPEPGLTYISNIAFTVNYLFSSASLVWTLYWFYSLSQGKKYSTFKLYTIYVIVFLSATMHEGFSLPLSGFFLIYILKNYKHRIIRPIIILIILYWIGTLLTVSAPANFHRATETSYLVGSGEGFFVKIKLVLIGLLKGEYLIQSFVVTSILALIFRNKYTQFIRSIAPFIYIGLLSLCFDVFVAYIGNHQLVPIGLMMTIIFNCIFSRVGFFNNKLPNLICSSLTLTLLVVGYFNVFEARKNIASEWENLHKIASLPNIEYLNANKLIEACSSPTDIIQRFTQKRELMLHIQSKHFFEKLTSVKSTNGKDPDKIKGILPHSQNYIIQTCSDKNAASPHIFRANRYYILRIKKEDMSINNVNFILKSGIIGKILHKFRPQRIVQTYPILWDSHTFNDSDYIYTPVFIDPLTIDSIFIESNQN